MDYLANYKGRIEGKLQMTEIEEALERKKWQDKFALCVYDAIDNLDSMVADMRLHNLAYSKKEMIEDGVKRAHEFINKIQELGKECDV